MRQILLRIQSLLRTFLPRLPRYAVAGAWFFAIASMIPLIWIMFEGVGQGETSRVFGTTVNGVVHTVWGLTYSGAPGSLLLGLEVLALIAAIAAAALPGDAKFIAPELATRIRRIGHGYLTGWAGLWMLGTMHLAAVDPGFWTLQAIFIAALLACTVYRAVVEWRARNGKPDRNAFEAAEVSINSNADAEEADDDQGALETYQSNLTDIADVSRFMLYRSAVRPSRRVNEIDTSDAGDPGAASAIEEDSYGESIRAAVRHAIRISRAATRLAAIKCAAMVRSARAWLSARHPRQAVKVNVSAAENHTHTANFFR